MKPTSVIFLILSIILIASGIGLCFVAENMSSKEEIELYSQTTDEYENSIDRYDLNNADISRISLILKKANVNIITNADDSYIELINFSKNTYEFLLNLKTVSVDDTLSLVSLLNFMEGGFKFEGLRYFLTPDMYKDKQKTVNIYLPYENSLNVIDIKIGEGNLKIDNIIRRIDYIIEIEKGDIDLYRTRSSSVFTLKLNEGNVKLTDTLIINCNVTITNGNLVMNAANYDNQNYELTTTLGNIYFGKENMGGTYSQTIPVSATNTLVFVGTGDITIDQYNQN